MDAETFISTLTGRLDGMGHGMVENLIDTLVDVVADECATQGRVALPSLGSFAGRLRRETVSRDLSTGQRLLLPPMVEIEFTPGSGLKKMLNAQ